MCVNKQNQRPTIILTSNIACGQRTQSSASFVGLRNTIQNAQQRFGQPQQIAKTVKSEVDKISRQFHHFECQFILILVGEQPQFRCHIAQIVLNECNCRIEACTNCLLVRIRLFFRVVAMENKLKNLDFSTYDASTFALIVAKKLTHKLTFSMEFRTINVQI